VTATYMGAQCQVGWVRSCGTCPVIRLRLRWWVTIACCSPVLSMQCARQPWLLSVDVDSRHSPQPSHFECWQLPAPLPAVQGPHHQLIVAQVGGTANGAQECSAVQVSYRSAAGQLQVSYRPMAFGLRLVRHFFLSFFLQAQGLVAQCASARGSTPACAAPMAPPRS
jgi:hypothetical protein